MHPMDFDPSDPSLTPEEMAERHKQFVDMMKEIDASWRDQDAKVLAELQLLVHPLDGRKSTAAIFGLCAIQDLQANHVTICSMACLLLKYGIGRKNVTEGLIREIFKKTSSTTAGRQEDPPEDVFVARICTARGEFLAFEGNWEASTYQLERFCEIMDCMPDSEPFVSIVKSAYALIKMGDEMARRSKCLVDAIYCEIPLDGIPGQIDCGPDALRSLSVFSDSDFKRIGISIEDIRPFQMRTGAFESETFPFYSRMTPLDRTPVVKIARGKYTLYPQAISVAIRMLIIERFAQIEVHRKILERNYIVSVRKCLARRSMLGSLGRMRFICPPQELPGCYIDECCFTVSHKRILHIVVIYDRFDGDPWICGMHGQKLIDPKELDLSHRTAAVSSQLLSQDGSAITLLVFATWGRAIGIQTERNLPANWRVVVLSAFDLHTINCHPDIDEYDFWRIQKAKATLAAHGGKISNVNGIMNEFGWMMKNDGHLVPHEQLPNENIPDEVQLVIPTNGIATFRVAARNSSDRRMARRMSGELRIVEKARSRYYFKEDNEFPIYADPDAISMGTLAGVHFGKGTWWVVANGNREIRDLVYRIWDAGETWIKRIALCLEKRNANLPLIIEWHLLVSQYDSAISKDQQVISECAGKGLIRTHVRISPNGIFSQTANTGERRLVSGFICCLLERTESEISDLIKEIVPSNDARQFHLFPVKTYTDVMHDKIHHRITSRPIDDATARLGLGWGNETPRSFLHINGKEKCVKHLQIVVDGVWNKLSNILGLISRHKLCGRLVVNMEAMQLKKQEWQRTIRACLALHRDKDNVRTVAGEEMSKIAVNSISCRLLCEMAICTCPDSGIDPDDLDISELMSLAKLLFQVGSWSDAINGELYPDDVRVSVFGQVMLDYSFERNSLTPFTLDMNRRRINGDERRYKSHYESPAVSANIDDYFSTDFNDAWKAEFGLSVSEIMRIIDAIEDIGVKQDAVFYIINKSKLLDEIVRLTANIQRDDLALFLSRVTLPRRLSWNQFGDDLPHGAVPSDWYPWCYRRRLSMVSRPILEITNTTESGLLISPGFFRESLRYLVENCWEASFDERFFDSNKMRRWIGHRRNESGNAFNREVADKLRELGWNTISDIKMTEILSMKLDRDYGDVDVLAWTDDSPAVLVIECKDVLYAKTHREIANQINEFRGRCDSNSRRDRLRRHFDRLDNIVAHSDALRRYMKKTSAPQVVGVLVFKQNTIVKFAPMIPRDRIAVLTYEELTGPNGKTGKLPAWKFDGQNSE